MLSFRPGPPPPSFARWGLTLGAAALAMLGGCAVVGPTYETPAPRLSATWQAVLPHDGSVDALTDWWARFDDPAVPQLVRWAEAESASVATAAARIDAARATLASNNAAGLPSLSSTASVDRARQVVGTAASTATTRSVGADAAWEIDLFGKVRRSREAAGSRIDARRADWHEARVSVAAEVVTAYVDYRACRLLEADAEGEVASQRETLRITEVMARAGLSASADLDLAAASLAAAQSTRISRQADCEGLVKSLVALSGVEEPALRPVIDAPADTLPLPPAFAITSVPSDVLRQRPDVAASEREVAAASAEIGQAEANRYPSFSLAGSIALAASGGTAAMTSWSFGPSLSLPLFDGGQRRAAVDSARAAYDVARATYLGTVRTAVKEVEQALVSLRGASLRNDASREAALRYRRYFAATETHWRAGGTDLLSLEVARRSAFSAETDLIGLERDHVDAWIALYKAIGGGWQAPSADDTASTSKGSTP